MSRHCTVSFGHIVLLNDKHNQKSAFRGGFLIGV